MTEDELKDRLKKFALRIITLVDNMPQRISSIAIAKQIIRSGTSSSANYRAACLAKSDNDFIYKLKVVAEELDETSHWLDLIIESGIMPDYRVKPLYEESIELLRIITGSIRTTQARIESMSLI